MLVALAVLFTGPLAWGVGAAGGPMSTAGGTRATATAKGAAAPQRGWSAATLHDAGHASASPVVGDRRAGGGVEVGGQTTVAARGFASGGNAQSNPANRNTSARASRPTAGRRFAVGDHVLVKRSNGEVTGGTVTGHGNDDSVHLAVERQDGSLGHKSVAAAALTPRIAIGESVRVPRSDGSTSVGRVVARYPNGRVTVHGSEHGQQYSKTLHESELAQHAAHGDREAPATRGPHEPFVSTHEGYLADRVFSDWVHGPIPSEGWKLHVSANEGNEHHVAERVLPVLRELGVSHKIVTTPHLYKTAMTGGQAGKFITIYPKSADQAAEVARVLEGRLTGLHGPPVAGERKIGKTGMISTRYGGFTKATVTHPDGREVGDVRGQVSPPWVADPFAAHGL